MALIFNEKVVCEMSQAAFLKAHKGLRSPKKLKELYKEIRTKHGFQSNTKQSPKVATPVSVEPDSETGSTE